MCFSLLGRLGYLFITMGWWAQLLVTYYLINSVALLVDCNEKKTKGKVSQPEKSIIISPRKITRVINWPWKMIATQVARRVARPVSKRCISFKTENKIKEIRQKYYMNPAVGKFDWYCDHLERRVFSTTCYYFLLLVSCIYCPNSYCLLLLFSHRFIFIRSSHFSFYLIILYRSRQPNLLETKWRQGRFWCCNWGYDHGHGSYFLWSLFYVFRCQ